MDPRTFPTKGNLMLAKNSLALARQGYELMDKKRNILIRELMELIDQARSIQEEIDSTFTYAYQCLQKANIERRDQPGFPGRLHRAHRGLRRYPDTEHHGDGDPPCEIHAADAGAHLRLQQHEGVRGPGGGRLPQGEGPDVKLSMVENAAYRLATNIKKTQKRANAPPEYHDPHVHHSSCTTSPTPWRRKREKSSPG